MSKFGKLIGISPKPSQEKVTSQESFVEKKPQIKEDEKGHFTVDDPITSENKGWVSDLYPPKNRKTLSRKK